MRNPNRGYKKHCILCYLVICKTTTIQSITKYDYVIAQKSQK